jgi:hypothetical protein
MDSSFRKIFYVLQQKKDHNLSCYLESFACNETKITFQQTILWDK